MDEECKDLVVVEEIVDVGHVMFDATKVEVLVKCSGAGAWKVSLLGTLQSMLPEPQQQAHKPLELL